MKILYEKVKAFLFKIRRDLETYQKRNKNLIERLSDLPKDLSADGIYAQIKENKNRIEELEKMLNEVQGQERRLSTLSVDREGLIVKVKIGIYTPVVTSSTVY